MPMKNFLKKYYDYQDEYEKMYGNKTIVLLQKGSFYNIFQSPKSNKGRALEMCDVLNLLLTRTSKKHKLSESNPHMCGFPSISYEKHRDILLNLNYTVVRIDQLKSGTSFKHEIGEIVGPGTSIDINNSCVMNCIMNIFVEVYIPKNTTYRVDELKTIFAVSCIDVTTGKCMINEFYGTDINPQSAIQNTYKCLLNSSPKLLIISCTANTTIPNNFIEYLTSQLDHSNIIIQDKIPKDVTNVSYQSQLLNKLYTIPKECHQNIIEYLNLEELSYARISFILLLQYCYSQNETIIQKLDVPCRGWNESNDYLNIIHNSALQLNLIPSSTSVATSNKKKVFDSLLSILDMTCTNMGKRYLHHRLLNPLTSTTSIQLYYDCIQELIDNPDIHKSIDKILKRIPDIHRLHHKLHLSLIKPHELYSLIQAYRLIVDLYNLIIKTQYIKTLKFDSVTKKQFIQSIKFYNKTFTSSLSKALIVDNKLECTEPCIKSDVNSEIDNLLDVMKQEQIYLNKLCIHINSYISKVGGKSIELSYSSKDGYYIETTLNKCKRIKDSPYDTTFCGNLEFTFLKKRGYITSNKIESSISELTNCRTNYEEKLYEMYIQTIKKLSDIIPHQSIIDFVQEIDYISSAAHVATKYHYYKPKLDLESEYSYFHANKLRHPIIERLINTEYISNDVHLNHDNSGILLYGCNSTGKTSLVKSIGLCLIMAQCGMFVSAQLTYHPYKRIVTRLSGNDNLFKGQSSFIVEMSELRTILQESDDSTLVLGDELCRGTENISGTSLTVATISTLVKRNTSFVFSTHMHHLSTHEELVPHIQTNKLSIKHLSITYDDMNKTLIYDRKLSDGPGSSIYGLEVARSLNLNKDFLDMANSIRHKLSNLNPLIMTTKKSRYNSDLYMDQCVICGTTNQLQTHHIHEQHLADEYKYIGDFHKDSLHNLMVLCDKCHDTIHGH